MTLHRNATYGKYLQKINYFLKQNFTVNLNEPDRGHHRRSVTSGKRRHIPALSEISPRTYTCS